MSDRPIQLAIVIVNYRTANLVIQCLESLLDQLADFNARVVVVDNCSQDGSVGTLRDWIVAHDARHQVQLIDAGANNGFSAGYNVGLRVVNSDYYLLLNSDTIVRPGAIALLIETAQRYPEAGLISPRLEWPNEVPQQSCFRDPSPISELIDAAQTGPITKIPQHIRCALAPQRHHRPSAVDQFCMRDGAT